jgi:hypothetical protein
VLVGEQRAGLLERHPACVVDLVRRSEGACGRGHLPVADGLGSSLRIMVGGGPDLTGQPAAQSRLLLDLAQRRLGLGLARVELALGERPVVVGRPVDQDDLDPAAPAMAPDDPAAGRTTDSVMTDRLAGSGQRLPGLQPPASPLAAPTPHHPAHWLSLSLVRRVRRPRCPLCRRGTGGHVTIAATRPSVESMASLSLARVASLHADAQSVTTRNS